MSYANKFLCLAIILFSAVNLSWGLTNILSGLSNFTSYYTDIISKKLPKNPNILLLLADDLGYGDTSVFPFVTEKVDLMK